MEHSSPSAPFSDAFARRFTIRAGGAGKVLTFAEFMDVALYDPEVGYYQSLRGRVGRSGGADFYTASSLADVFGLLVAAGATGLLGATRAAECDFIEIGAEPGRGVLDSVDHGFRSVRTVHVGDPIELRGNAVVFSNELFDAQSFHRVVFRGGSWRELGVSLAAENLAWVELPECSAAVAAMADRLPAAAPEGYVIDLPLGAEQLTRFIVSQPWQGLFLAFDYGRTWPQLAGEYPSGTGRAYARHRQSGDLLAQPGEQDLTCHICWDWLEGGLRDAGFTSVTRESQESFFVRRATAAVERIVAGETDLLSPQRSQLKHLLHPALMGQRFEVLWAKRPV
jgi:SAM-dependent MidA family methyltransferase